MIINHSFRIRDPEHASKLELSRLRRTGNYEGHIKMRTQFLSASHKHVFPSTITRSLVNRHASHIVTKTFSDSQKDEQSAVQDPFHALINVLYNQTLAEDQIEDTREHAYTKNFRRHGGSLGRTAILLIVTHFCMSTPFDHDSAAALAIVFELPSQKTRIASNVVGTFFCRYQFSSVPVRLCWPSGLLPDYFPCRCVSRSCRCSRSVWLLLSSTRSARLFECFHLSLCTLFLGQLLH